MESAREAKPSDAKRKRVEEKPSKKVSKTYVSRWFESDRVWYQLKASTGMMQMGDMIITSRCSIRIYSVTTANVWMLLGCAPKRGGKTFVIEMEDDKETLDLVIQSSSFAEGIKKARVALVLKMDKATIDYIEMFGVKDVCEF